MPFMGLEPWDGSGGSGSQGWGETRHLLLDNMDLWYLRQCEGKSQGNALVGVGGAVQNREENKEDTAILGCISC